MTPTRRRLVAIDDPLSATPPAETRRSAPRPAAEHPTTPLYVRLPVAQSDELARAAFELRAHKRTIVTALVAEYVHTTDDGLAALRALLQRHGDLC